MLNKKQIILIFIVLLFCKLIACVPSQEQIIKDDNILTKSLDNFGPIISILKPVNGDSFPDYQLVIEGIVSDNSGVNKIVINKRETINTYNRTKYTLNHIFKLLPDEDYLLIEAWDKYENLTAEKITLRQWSGLITLPFIEVWNIEDNQKYSSQTILFEGMAYDKKGIKQLFINDKELLIKPANKVHFCQEILINQGLNTIKIVAKNISGLKSTKLVKIINNKPKNSDCGIRNHYNIFTTPVRNLSSKNNRSDYIDSIISIYYDFDNYLNVINNNNCFSVIQTNELKQLKNDQLQSKKLCSLELNKILKIGHDDNVNFCLSVGIEKNSIIKSEITIILELFDIKNNKSICQIKYIRKTNDLKKEYKQKIANELIRRLIDNLSKI